MHKIAAKEFDISDFSLEHLETIARFDEDGESYQPYMVMKSVIDCLNACRESYLKTKNKTDWWQMIQLLPSSYNQKRTVMLNYEVLAGIYPMRKNHKLDEWHVFCDWIKSLPYSEIIVGDQSEEFNTKMYEKALRMSKALEKTKMPEYSAPRNYLNLKEIERITKNDFLNRFAGTSVAMGVPLNVQRKLCGLPYVEITEAPSEEMRGNRAKIAVIDDFADIPKENSQAEKTKEVGEALLEGMKKAIDPAERNNDVSKAMKDIMDKLNADGATTEDISKEMQIEHLLDVTCSWQVEELGGRRLYMLAPGCTRNELTPYERTLLACSEEYERNRQEKERKNRKKKKNKRKK